MEMGYSQPQILLNWYLVMEHFCPQTWLLGLLIFLIVYQISLFFCYRWNRFVKMKQKTLGNKIISTSNVSNHVLRFRGMIILLSDKPTFNGKLVLMNRCITWASADSQISSRLTMGLFIITLTSTIPAFNLYSTDVVKKSIGML